MSKHVVARNVCNLYADESQSELVSQAILGQVVWKADESAEHIHVETGDLYKGHVRKHVLIAQSSCFEDQKWSCQTGQSYVCACSPAG